MATASLSTKKMPLPLEIFYGAMERQVPLADYAKTIDLHPDILRQALTGRLQGADSAPVDALAKAINRDPQELDLATVPFSESFGMWLKRNMEGITQHALRARAQLDNQTLKRFLNGDLLPDSDQAERISRALYIDRIEVARVITANMAAASPSIASQESAERGALGGQSAGQDSGSVSAAPPPPVNQGQQPTAQSIHLKKSRSRRQPSQAIASGQSGVIDASTSIQSGRQPTSEEHPASQPVAPAAIDRAAALTPPVPAKIATDTEAGTGRPKRSTTRGLATVAAAAEQTPARTEMNKAADDRPVGGLAAEDSGSKQAGSRRRPRIIAATATDVSTSGAVPSALAAEIVPPTPGERSADISTGRTAPLVAAERADDTTTLLLSPDEVRLIRHWRQLHPHGRRATLHYIGSLLVDD